MVSPLHVNNFIDNSNYGNNVQVRNRLRITYIRLVAHPGHSCRKDEQWRPGVATTTFIELVASVQTQYRIVPSQFDSYFMVSCRTASRTTINVQCPDSGMHKVPFTSTIHTQNNYNIKKWCISEPCMETSGQLMVGFVPTENIDKYLSSFMSNTQFTPYLRWIHALRFV